MTHYAITQVHFEGGEIARVLLHAVELNAPNEFDLAVGVDTPVEDVANLLAGGDRVYIAAIDGPGAYAKADEVVRKTGTGELVSAAIIGRAQLAFKDLPSY